MQNLEQILRSFGFFSDESIYDELKPKLIPLLLGKKDITQQSLFNDFYKDFMTQEQINYSDVVQLFEDMCKAQSIWNKRQKYLLYHWLYYQAFKVKPSINQEGAMRYIKQTLEIKQDAVKTTENIAKHFQFNAKQSMLFKNNVQTSSIYDFFDKYQIVPSSELSPQKIEQKHQELLYIIQKMSDAGKFSIQYELQKLILVSFEKAYKKSSEVGIKLQLQIMETKSFQSIIVEQKRMNDKIKRKLQELNSNKDEKSRYNILEGIKFQLTSLDVFLLDYLISLSSKNLSENGKKDPKNIVLFVGPSGSGKTTIILRVLGYQLIQTEISQLTTLQPVDLKQEHKALRTSPQSTSTTRYMFSAKIPQSSFNPGTQEDLQLCDSPGFEDSAGSEVDISNSISIHTFLKYCASVKLVLVISQRKIGQKMQGIRQIARIVSNLVTNYSDIEESVLLVLNKFQNQKEYNQIRPRMQSMLKNLTSAEKSDKSYVNFLNSLLRRFKSNQKSIIRFNPTQTSIQDFVQQIKQTRINNPCDIFKYSLSTKSKQCISNRKGLLVRLIKQLVGKNNTLGLYYLNQLNLLNASLNDVEVEAELKEVKDYVEKLVQSKFKTFQEKIKEILINDANTNSFNELNKIMEQVQAFQIFKKSIKDLITKSTLQDKVKQIKQQLLKKINQLTFQHQKIDQQKRQVVNTIKFFEKIQPEKQKQVHEKLIEAYIKNKGQLEKVLQNKQYTQIKKKTIVLKNIFEIICKSKQTMRTVKNNPQIAIIDKKEFKIIIQIIEKQFQEVVEQSVSFIEQSKQNPSYYEIKPQIITKVQQNITIFENIEQQGPILDQVKVYKYKQQIINNICSFGRQLIDQINAFLQSANKEISQNKIQLIQHTKSNLSKIRQIKAVYTTIETNINYLWRNFERFIQKETKKLNQFLTALKTQKKINRNTLKHFKSMIDRILKFSKGDIHLVNSTNQLKIQIKKSIIQHIKIVKSKTDKSKITLKLKNTIEWVQLSKIFERFKQIEAFFKTKSICKPAYFNANQINDTIQINLSESDLQKNKSQILSSAIFVSKINVSSSEDQDDDDFNDVNLFELIKQMYVSIIKKLIFPFHQIKEQSKKAKDKGIKKITSSYLQFLNDFLHYKSNLFENDLTSNKDLQKQMQKLNNQQNNYPSIISGIVNDLKQYFDQLYHESIQEKNPKMQIFRFQVQQIKQFRKLCNVLLIIKHHKHLEEFFLEEKFGCTQYLQKIVEMLKKSNQEINKELKKRQNNIQYLDNLIYLKNQVQQMKNFDQFDFENDKTSSFEFTKIYQKVCELLKEIQGKQQNSIINLFKDQTIILSDVERMYQHLMKDEFKNSQNLIVFYDNLKAYVHNKLLKSIHVAKQQYKNEQTMDLQNQNAYSYIVRLQKAFNFYEGLNKFIKKNFMEVFTMNQSYFITQISSFQIQQKLKHTYETVKLKLQTFEYKTKPRQFEKIITVMKKAEYIVDKVTDKTVYSQLYNYIQSQQIGETDFKGSKFSQRLKHLMNKNANQVKDVFANAKNETIQEFLQTNNFINRYNNLTQQQIHMVDTKIQKIMQQKLENLENAYSKTEEEKKNSEENIRNFLDKLPQKIRNQYRKRFDNMKNKLRQKEENEVRHIKRQLSSASNNSIFQSINKLQECKNITVEKQLKTIITSQLKALGKEIIIFGANKKFSIIQSFKKYLKYFGFQNNSMIQKIKDNQKIKDIFLSEQKAFLANLIAQQKEAIRQIESQFGKDLDLYNQKCKQLNQLYLLAVQDNYEGMCLKQRAQILCLWQQFIEKIKNIIKELIKAPSININNFSAVKTQKKIVKLSFIRNFINQFIERSSKIKTSKETKFQFIYQTNKIFSGVNIDRIITTNLSQQINQLLNEVRSKNFYDNQIKILNFATLQIEFERKLVNSLRLLQEYQSIYNQYLCQNEGRYSTIKLIDLVQTKWQQNYIHTTNQFEQAIRFPQEQISQRITILHNLTQIITKRRWDVIDKHLKSRENLQNFLDEKFNQIKELFCNDIKSIEHFVKKKANITKNYQEIKISLKLIIDQIQKQCVKKKQQLEKNIQETVDQSAKEKLTLQHQNIQNLKNQKILNLQNKHYTDFLAQKKDIQQQIKLFIKTNVIKHLIIMKKVLHSVHWKPKENQRKLIQFLQDLSKQQKNIKQKIFEELNASNNNYALIIAAESDIFKAQAALQFKNKTSNQGIQYILANCQQLKMDKEMSQKVSSFYHMYSREYSKIIDAFQANPDKEQINLIAKQLRDLKDQNQKLTRPRDNVHPALIISKIFAIWSMSKVDLSDKDKISIDFQPHPAQIVAIYLLIGLSDYKFENKLIEVLTGEGKSIVLAGLCIFLALKGYRPYCACYSQYLSSRDEKEFKELFDLLDISHKIKYGTFNQHCEDIINEASTSLFTKIENNKAFRQQMKLVIMNKANNSTIDYFAKIFDQKAHKSSKKILIIDEADVFFNENFFGRLYCPSLSLDDQQIKKLIVYIWNITKQSRQNDKIDKIQAQQVYTSDEFKKVALKYSAISDLIKNQLIGMLQAAYNYKHGYIIHQDSIKYRDNDSITDKISYGYKTVFANCFEYQRKAISQISYNLALKITLNIAPFSYSQLPKFFQSILGVSGTVKSMSDFKRQMLGQRYGIEDTYQIPSIYGSTQRTKDCFTISKDDQFYDQIVKHAKIPSQSGRPIALFFKTIKDVTNFYKSSQFSQFTKNTTILTEQTDHELRQTLIKRVGQRGKITILTEAFARGTDFKIFDKSINDIGGLHVIQTFISSDLSEYIQTRGRTARQGSKGSFQVLVNQTQLQKFEIVCNQDSQFEQKMKDAWKQRDSTQCVLLLERVDNAKEKHGQTQNLFKKRPNQADIIKFIYSHNKFNEIRKNHVKTLIGIDGTASMGLALKKVFGILEDSFTRTKTVLQKKKVAGSFENQIGIYRNYDSDFERLLESSSFEADSQKLKDFLQNIQISGGWGNEAIQILLQHANKIQKLDQIIVIADARANTIEQTKRKRAKSGQNYWVTNGFPMTNQAEQVLKLKQKKIKIHTLYINLENSDQLKRAQLKKYCQSISKQTGGVSQQLKLKDNNASQFLTGFLVRNILMLIGGQEKGRELVDSYNQDFSSPLRL